MMFSEQAYALKDSRQKIWRLRNAADMLSRFVL